MSNTVYLTKSRYAAGLQCLRRLWLNVHELAEWEDRRPRTACQRLRSSPTSRSRKRATSTSSVFRSGVVGPILTRGMGFSGRPAPGVARRGLSAVSARNLVDSVGLHLARTELLLEAFADYAGKEAAHGGQRR
jgi:hypothetical protein